MLLSNKLDKYNISTGIYAFKFVIEQLYTEMGSNYTIPILFLGANPLNSADSS